MDNPFFQRYFELQSTFMMKKERDYFQDIAEIRSMMERSSKFVTISGWSGILAGIYALAGAYIAHAVLHFNPRELVSQVPAIQYSGLGNIILLAVTVLVLALGTAVLLSYKKAEQRGENIWNPTSRRLLAHLAIPLLAGGILILILISKGLVSLMAPMSLLFYGLALYNTSKFTYEWVKVLGLVQIGLGLVSAFFLEYGLLFWAFGFGVVHIIYGIYMHFKYER